MCLRMLSYSKVSLDEEEGFEKIENFVKGLGNLNVKIYEDNPITNKNVEAYKVFDNVEPYFFGREFHFGENMLNLRVEASTDTVVYIGTDEMLVRIPRGYKCAFTYYYFQKVNK